MTDKRDSPIEIYLEPLTAETLKRIIEKEKPDSLLAGLGGQTGLTLSMQLCKGRLSRRARACACIGTNRGRHRPAPRTDSCFKDTMEAIGQPVHPLGHRVPTLTAALAVAERIGYPVIVRPAFTLGGAGGGVAYDADELRADCAQTASTPSPIHADPRGKVHLRLEGDRV